MAPSVGGIHNNGHRLPLGWFDPAIEEGTERMPIVAVAAGTEHVLALTDEGTVVSWGNAPEAPAGLTNVTAIAAGSYVSLALLENGTVVGWGTTEVPDGLSDVVAITAGGLVCFAKKRDGSIVGWKKRSYFDPTEPVVWSGQDLPSAVSLNGGFAIGIESGRLLHQDINGMLSGSVPMPPPTLTNVTAVSAGFAHALILSGAGEVTPWADTRQIDSASLRTPGTVRQATSVAAGGAFAIALLSDGRVASWGHNEYGQAESPPGLSNVVAIAAGTHFGVALTSEGTVVAWGRNEKGQTTVPAEFAAPAWGDVHERAVGPLALNRELTPQFVIVDGSPDEDTEIKLTRLPADDSLLSTAREMSSLARYGGEYAYEGRRAAACSLNNYAARQIAMGVPLRALDSLAEADQLLQDIPEDAYRLGITFRGWVTLARATVFFNYCLANVQAGNLDEAPRLITAVEQLLGSVTSERFYHADGVEGRRVDLIRTALERLQNIRRNVSVAFGDARHGFLVPISMETLRTTGLANGLTDLPNGARGTAIGPGTGSKFNITLADIAGSMVAVLLSNEDTNKPGEGLFLEYVGPDNPWFGRCQHELNGNWAVTGIPAIIQTSTEGAAQVYVILT